MEKIIRIKQCWTCPYFIHSNTTITSDKSWKNIGYCSQGQGVPKNLEDTMVTRENGGIFQEIPDWCKLETSQKIKGGHHGMGTS